jgi:hypothetical protein
MPSECATVRTKPVRQSNGRIMPGFGPNPGPFSVDRWDTGGRKKGLGKDQDLWYYFVAFDALVSPLER